MQLPILNQTMGNWQKCVLDKKIAHKNEKM